MKKFKPSPYGDPQLGSSAAPVGPDEMYLVTDSSPVDDLSGITGPLHKRSWFWPVVAFGVALGVAQSVRSEK